MIHEHLRPEHLGHAPGERARHRRAGVAQLGDGAQVIAADVGQRDEVVVERRHQVERAHAHVLKEAGGGGGVPVGQADQRAVEQRHRDHRAHAHGVIERHGPQRALAEGVAALHDVRERGAGLGAVGARHALGTAGGARGVEHDADVVVPHRDIGWPRVGVARRQRLEVDRVGRRLGAGVDPVPHARQVRPGRQYRRDAGSLEHHGHAVGVVHAEAHLALGIAPVERGGDEPQLLAGPVDGHVLLAVLEQDDHVLAARQAEARQRGRHPIHARVEGLVRRAAPAVGDRLRGRRALGGHAERAGQHQKPSSTILPTTCPSSSSAWAFLRLAALMGARRVAAVLLSVPASTSVAASSRIWCWTIMSAV